MCLIFYIMYEEYIKKSNLREPLLPVLATDPTIPRTYSFPYSLLSPKIYNSYDVLKGLYNKGP